MDKLQADAVARAVLEPDLEFKKALRRRHAEEEQRIADRRIVAWCALIGAATGTVAAVMAGIRFSNGTLWGAVAGTAIGWLVAWRRRRPPTSEPLDGE